MSNQVNDQIADRVIDEVSELSRVEVFKELLVHKELDELFQAFNANGTIVRRRYSTRLTNRNQIQPRDGETRTTWIDQPKQNKHI